MIRAGHSGLLPLALAGVFLAGPSPSAAEVKDHAALFKGQAVQQADEAIRQIR